MFSCAPKFVTVSININILIKLKTMIMKETACNSFKDMNI